MANWLSKAFQRNRSWLGNALKNFAPVAGALTGGLGGIAIGGLGSALGRGVQKGASLGNIVGQGVSGAGMAYGGSKALGALKSAFAPGSSAASVMQSGGEVALDGADDIAGVQGGNIAATRPVAARAGSAARGAGIFLKDNPMAAAMALQGVGDLSTAGTQNDMARAQIDAIRSQTAESEEERARRRRMEEALEPLRLSLLGQLQGTQRSVPANPYL